MYQSEHTNELMAALAKAQGKISGAIKDCNNPYFKSKYADLNSVWNACRIPLSENGLCVTQTILEKEAGGMSLKTTLGHASGQWVTSMIPLNFKSDNKKNEVHELGSILTYMRRYALAAIVGVAPDDDDDGNGASNYTSAAPPAKKSDPNGNINIIGQPQVDELRSLLSKCEEGFVEYITRLVNSWGMANFESLSVGAFENIKSKINTYFEQKNKGTPK